jgi:hypothetical protein
MSRHPKKAPRSKSDFYATPPELVRRMVATALTICPAPAWVLEPGCDKAPFLREVLNQYPGVRGLVGIEYEPAPTGMEEVPFPMVLRFGTDFMAWAEEEKVKYDLIITNPPFSLALPFLRSGLKMLEEGGWLFYLLRLGWLEGKKRKEELHDSHPPSTVHVIVPRPSFTGGGTDATAYAMFGYERQPPRGLTRLGWLP